MAAQKPRRWLLDTKERHASSASCTSLDPVPMAMNSATMASSLRVFPAGAMTAGPAPSRSTNACAASFLVGRSSSARQASAALRLCRARPTASDMQSWWATELTPEDFPLDDFPEPTTGHGQEKLHAIWKTPRHRHPAARLARRARDQGLRPLLPLPQLPCGDNLWPIVTDCCFLPARQISAKILRGYNSRIYILQVECFSSRSELKRNGKTNNICARIQLVLLLILSYKDYGASLDVYRLFTKLIWLFGIYVYISAVYYEVIGEEEPRHHMLEIYKILQTKGGLMRVIKNLFLE